MRIEHRALRASAFLILASSLLWLYNQFSILLFRGTPIYEELSNFLPCIIYDDFQMIPGFIGSIIAILSIRSLCKAFL